MSDRYAKFEEELSTGSQGLEGETEVKERVKRADPGLNKNVLLKYLDMVEKLSGKYGDVLIHTGGARDEKRNKEVGGKPNSRHLWGRGDADDWVMDPSSERVKKGDVNIRDVMQYAKQIGLGAIVHSVKKADGTLGGEHLHTQYPRQGRLRTAKASPK